MARHAHSTPAGARTVTATFAAKNFGRLVNVVRETQMEYIVERGGVPVARVCPAGKPIFRGGDLVHLFQSLAPTRDDAFARAVEDGMARLNKPAVPKHPWER